MRRLRPSYLAFMRPFARPFTQLCCLSVLLGACSTGKDPWLGQDKALHFVASALIAQHLNTQLDDPQQAAMMTLAIGAAKEGWDDYRNPGSASWRDMSWNLAGTVAALGASPE